MKKISEPRTTQPIRTRLLRLFGPGHVFAGLQEQVGLGISLYGGIGLALDRHRDGHVRHLGMGSPVSMYGVLRILEVVLR